MQLVAVGGRAPGGPRPLPGSVVLRNGSTSLTRRVGETGTVTLDVPAGTYTVTGHSPLYGSNAYLCQADKPVTVVAEGHPPNFAQVTVYCQER